MNLTTRSAGSSLSNCYTRSADPDLRARGQGPRGFQNHEETAMPDSFTVTVERPELWLVTFDNPPVNKVTRR